MTLLFPSFLWLLVPLLLLLWRSAKKVQDIVHLIILLLLVLSLARPVEEQALQIANIQAKDIIIALDASYSMRAKDLSPTRYEFAKETIKSLLEKNPSDNIMLIAFTTNPLLLSPPTTDHALINIALQSLNPNYILTKGTSLKKLFTHLSKMELGHKNLILMTDGGEENNLVTLSTLLLDSDVSLTILALGTTKGTTIENKDGSLLKDKQDNLVISRINPLLKNLASMTKGSYVLPSSSAKATANNLDSILRQNHTQAHMIQKMQRHYAERYQVPLALAALLFLMLHTRGVKYLILLFTLIGLPLQASFVDEYHLNQAYNSYNKQNFNHAKQHLKKIKVHSLQSQIALANAYYKEGNYKKAINIYKSIRSTSLNTKQQLYYNIANAYAMLQAYDKAKIYYTKTLQLGEDKDAAYNLKLIALLKDKNDASLGIAHPKSQSSASSKAESTQKEKDDTREEDQPSSGSGGGEESSSKENKIQDKSKLTSDESQEQQPLGSKVYELINKGYIRETQPW